ncbi:MAG: hypothetical protein KBB79_03110 [Candidatus Omnitrophica bacterium]|nr:hypothetical protein [Candidatus Omnitrophota bacterium]
MKRYLILVMTAFSAACACAPAAGADVITIGPARDVELKAEGYGRAASSKYELSVTAQAKRLSNGDAVLVKYKTNLPRMTVLYMSVRSLDQVLVTRKQTVEGPEFAIRFGPFDNKKFSPGIYVVEVSCLPERQESGAVRQELSGADKLVASAELRVGNQEDFEVTTGKRRAALITELKELDSLYLALNDEYASQKKEFNKAKWDAFSEDLRLRVKKIGDLDADYRSKMLVMDYAAQENIKMMIVDTLGKLLVRYTERLCKDNGIDFSAPPSPDNRPAEMLNLVMQELLVNSKSFIEQAKLTNP